VRSGQWVLTHAGPSYQSGGRRMPGNLENHLIYPRVRRGDKRMIT
jgi:hypothetical protein